MPTPFKYVGGKVKADYTVSMSWDFKAKLSDLPPEGIKVKQEQLGAVPLRGDWGLNLRNRTDDLVIDVLHGQVPHAALGERVTVTGTFAYCVDGTFRQLHNVSWSKKMPQPKLRTDGSLYDGFGTSCSKSKLAAHGLLLAALMVFSGIALSLP